jgi:hypothetical protein
MKKDNILKEKSFAFALRIIKCYQYLQTKKHEYVLSKQLLSVELQLEQILGKLSKHKAR